MLYASKIPPGSPQTRISKDWLSKVTLVTKDTSVQATACSECPDPSPGAPVSVCSRCRQVEDLIRQVAELQETVSSLRSIRGAELAIDT